MAEEFPSADAVRERVRRQIRARLRALRAAYPAAALAQRSERARERILALDAFRAARRIALFWPLEHELDLRPLDAHCRADGRFVYYPVLDASDAGRRTGFALSSDPGELEARGSRFHEPPPSAPRAARGEIDLVIVPALAVALSGHRLGYGSGFYDAALPDFCPPATSVVVAFDFQLLAELPELAHDVRCDWLVTDARSVEIGPAQRG